MSLTDCKLCGQPWADHGTACPPDSRAQIAEARKAYRCPKCDTGGTGMRYAFGGHPEQWHLVCPKCGHRWTAGDDGLPNTEGQTAAPKTSSLNP